MGRMVSPRLMTEFCWLEGDRKHGQQDPAREFSTGARRASAAPSQMGRKAESNVGRGNGSDGRAEEVGGAASSLKAPASPWKAMRICQFLGIVPQGS